MIAVAITTTPQETPDAEKNAHKLKPDPRISRSSG